MFKKILNLLLIIISIASFTALFGTPKAEWTDYMLELHYKENFKIMQLADIQAHASDWCDGAFVPIKKQVEKEKPDLIVLTGDNIEIPQSEDVLYSLISHMESLETPWAPVFGNHDAEGVLTKDFMAEKFAEAEHCLFYKGEQGVDGVGNFVINLTNSFHRIKYSLFLLDSNMYDGKGGYDCIHANQVEWYERAVNQITKIHNNKVVPSLAFFHIPLQEYHNAKASWEKGESEGVGIFKDPISPGSENTGLFAKVKELGSTKAIICGHEHMNTCDINYQGVHLVYGLKSSRCSYYDETMLGTTIITLTRNNIDIRNSYFE